MLVRVWSVEEDRREFAEFYAAARDDCLRALLVNVGDRQLAEDLVAEAFTKAWMAWRKVRQHPAARGWIVRTALNAHVSWWRRHRREVALAGQEEPAAAADHPALDSALVAALRRLPVRNDLRYPSLGNPPDCGSAEPRALATIVVPARAVPPARGSPTRIEAL